MISYNIIYIISYNIIYNRYGIYGTSPWGCFWIPGYVRLQPHGRRFQVLRGPGRAVPQSRRVKRQASRFMTWERSATTMWCFVYVLYVICINIQYDMYLQYIQYDMFIICLHV